MARSRPLEEARTIRRGEDKGKLSAEVRPEVVAHLEELGRERALIYRTLVFTGLRLNELRTLTVAQLDFSPGAEMIRLEAKNEKNRAGSTIPLRSDLTAELRDWIAAKRLPASVRLFTVPAGLRCILDRDLEAAGIPKRDERKRTVDVHALRTTFGTMLSMTGTGPRMAQAAMRHSDIKLTMGIYTDPKLLDVRDAMERLPNLQPSSGSKVSQVALHVAPSTDSEGQKESPSDIQVSLSVGEESTVHTSKPPRNVNEEAPVTSSDITGAVSGWRDLNPRPLAPQPTGVPSKRLKLRAILRPAAKPPTKTPPRSPNCPRRPPLRSRRSWLNSPHFRPINVRPWLRFWHRPHRFRPLDLSFPTAAPSMARERGKGVLDPRQIADPSGRSRSRRPHGGDPKP